jgi:hypothetical protein
MHKRTRRALDANRRGHHAQRADSGAVPDGATAT